jgi:hypothetical protein
VCHYIFLILQNILNIQLIARRTPTHLSAFYERAFKFNTTIQIMNKALVLVQDGSDVNWTMK